MEVLVPGEVALDEPLSYPQVPNIPVSQDQESRGAENTGHDSGPGEQHGAGTSFLLHAEHIKRPLQ